MMLEAKKIWFEGFRFVGGNVRTRKCFIRRTIFYVTKIFKTPVF